MGVERMKIMTETNNGFVLSEKDLELRGPGEVFGARQSGLPEFIVGDIVTDFNVLEVARQEAADIWKKKDWWVLPDYRGLAEEIQPENEQHQYFD
jgi:ATP-dependent DNA helicase RecG